MKQLKKQQLIFHTNAYFFLTFARKLKCLVFIRAAISFFYLSTMKPLLWHMNNKPLISAAHSKAFLALNRMRGQTLILMI